MKFVVYIDFKHGIVKNLNCDYYYYLIEFNFSVINSNNIVFIL